jgi:hypothetical protein
VNGWEGDGGRKGRDDYFRTALHGYVGIGIHEIMIDRVLEAQMLVF